MYMVPVLQSILCSPGIRPDESVRRLIRDQVVPLWKFKNIDMKRYKKQAIMKGMAVDAKKEIFFYAGIM